MKKGVCFVLFALIWIAACSGNTSSTANASATPIAAQSPLPHSMKGYELYSWQEKGQWHFTLITGTNRVKTLEEITSGEDTVTSDGWVRISVEGVDAIKTLLGRLPPNEEIFWADSQWFKAGDITLPPQETIDAIKEHCKSLGLELMVSENTQTPQNTPPYHVTATPVPETDPSALSSVTPAPDTVQSADKPTPVVHWNADVIEVSWDDYTAVSQPEWLSDIIAKLAIYPAGFSDGYVTVDISAGKDAKAMAASVNSDWRIYSPQKTFVIECSGGMKMYRVKDNGLVSETSLYPPLSPGVICSTFIQWAPDESVASFVAADNTVYLWRSNGDEPQKIMDHTSSVFIAWSPNSQELAVEKSETDSHTGTVNVFDVSGKVLHEFQFQAGGDGAVLGWLTDDVLASYSRSTTWYYDVQTGQLLFSWTNMPTGDGIEHQPPQVSPDGRWVFIDQGGQRYESASDPNLYIVQKEYSLYDIREKKLLPLLNQAGNYLGFAGWNRDSSKMYVVSRPAESASISDPSTPFGLLTYDVQTHQFESHFKEAVQVVWNGDKSWAFVVFATRDDQGKLGLAGGLWNANSGILIGQWHVSKQMVYQDPAADTSFPAFPGPIPVAWSHDGQRVAVSDGYGRVKLLDVHGAEQVLTDEMSGSGVALRWSPDDRHLLVVHGGRAWIVNMSIP